MAYDGFISYSHAADDRLAPALQRGLQLLAKPWNSRRALRIFRDETGLSTNPHLWSSIEQALDESEWFVLLASEEAAQSEWVNKEITHWLATKPADHILPVVTDGTWDWDPVKGGFTAQSSAVPAALHGALRDEPRHLDLRWARGQIDLDLRNSRFRSAVADLAAPMHGIAKDELEGEDIRQHRRARRLARSAVGALVLLVAILALVSVFAVAQRNSARDATAVAHQELLVSESQGLLSSNRQLATLLAVEADLRQPSAATRDALMDAILAEPLLQRSFASTIYGSDMAALAGHRIVVLGKERGATLNPNVLQVWNWQTGRRQAWPQAPLGDDASGPLDMSATADGGLLAVISRDGMIQLYDGRTLRPEGRPLSSGLGRFTTLQANISLSPNGNSLAVSGADLAADSPYAGRSVSIFSRVGSQWVPDPPLQGDQSRVDAVAFSSDGSVIATASPTPAGSDIVVDEVANGQRLFSFASVPVNSGHGAIALDWSRRRIVLGTLPGGMGDAVWYDLDSADPTPHVLDVSSSAGVGDAYVGFDATDGRLGISASTGFGIFDAVTLTPTSSGPVLPNSTPGAFTFLDSVHVLTSLALGGPVSLWDLSGTSVLATLTAAQFNKGVFPLYPISTSAPFIGTSTLGNERSITLLGPGYRPLGPPIPIEQDLQEQPASVQHIIQQGVPAVVCRDPRNGDIATVSVSTGDIVVRDGTPPFPVVTDVPRIAAGLAPYLCIWSPDGHQIAIGSAPAGEGLGGPTSVGLYDVADKTLQDVPLSGELGLSSLLYSNDSATLWAGGVNTNTGVYRITDLDHDPRATVVFPGASAISADQDGRRLVVAYPTSLRVFDARSLKPLTRPIDLTGTTLIFGVRSAPDGNEASANSLQGWRLVDLDAQQAIGPWIPSPPISATAFGPDDSTVYAEAPTGGGEIWNLGPSNLRIAACGLAGRNLTQPEWQEYLSWAGPRRATCPQYPLT